MDTSIQEAIRLVTEGGVKNDRALLTLCEAIIERVTILEARMDSIQEEYDIPLVQDSMPRLRKRPNSHRDN